MIFGSILTTELLRTARAKWWYVFRTALGFGLLLIMYISHDWTFGRQVSGRGSVSHDELSVRAFRMLIYLGIVEGVCILVIVPALVAGAIAEEKQRKTLHYLLSSRLSSAEIVLEKLAARLLCLATPVALVIPVQAFP